MRWYRGSIRPCRGRDRASCSVWIALLIACSGVAPRAFAEGVLPRIGPGCIPLTGSVPDSAELAPDAGGLGHPVEELIPDWTAIQFDPFTLMPAVPMNPVLTAADVTDVHADFVADPFLFYENGVWYMFFEVFVTGEHGKIGLARSPDGLHWTYDQIVLSETYHHSYPFVFKYNGQYYMIPEATDQQSVRIYKALNFPYSWIYMRTLVSGTYYADPVLVRYANTWWLFVGQGGDLYCHLFYSDSLLGPYIRHPMSPIVYRDRSKARPAGRFFPFAGHRLFRLAQKCDVQYGEAVRAFEVDELSRSRYAEHEEPQSPILHASGFGWNAIAMHHCDPWWVGDHWLAAVDGRDEDRVWSIGLYRTPTVLGLEDLRPSPGGSSVRLIGNLPNPFESRTLISYEVRRGSGSSRISLFVYDANGRLVRTLVGGVPIPGIHAILWDGLDTEGDESPSGTYYYRLGGAEQAASGRMVLIR